MKNLEDFLRPTQKKLFKRLCKKFKGNTLISKGNFILVGGQAPVMLVAHLDTVHSQRVHDICKSDDGNILMSPQGIGGDDRCGVFALCKVYHDTKIKPWLLFCCDEEIGGLGAKKFCRAHKHRQLPNNLDNLKLIIEYVESCGSLYHSQKNRLYDKQDDIPRRIPSELKSIYEALLDFYSANELESFRAEFGNQILWQIYKDEIASFY